MVRGVFERFGFAPIETPAIERLETLQGSSGEEGDSLIFQILKRGGDLQRALGDYAAGGGIGQLSETGLRFDLTVPLARVVAQYAQEIPLPFMRYHIAPVWRAEAAQKGRFREFGQCDADIVGSSSVLADATIIQMIEATLIALGIDRFKIRVNNRRILDAMLNAAGVPDDRHIPALRALDKLEKIGRAEVLDEMTVQHDITLEAADRLLEFADNATDNGLDALSDLTDKAGMDELTQTLELVGQLISDPNHITFDAAVARGLSYYTGNVFETTLLDAPGIGSVMSGGRYDGLVGTFLGRDIPAVGVSLGIDRLFSAMEELALTSTTAKTAATYMVATLTEQQIPYAVIVATTLRAFGHNVYLYPDVVGLRKQLGHASTLGIPLVAIVGEEEVGARTVTVRDMNTRTQRTISLAELI